MSESERERRCELRVMLTVRVSQDEEGRTPLHFAADRGQSAVISRLLELGAVVDHRDSEGMTPLACAVTCENEDEIQLLVRMRPSKGEGVMEQARRCMPLTARRIAPALAKLLGRGSHVGVGIPRDITAREVDISRQVSKRGSTCDLAGGGLVHVAGGDNHKHKGMRLQRYGSIARRLL